MLNGGPISDAMHKALTPVSLARFDAINAAEGCMPNTRENVLSSIQAWADSPSSGLSIFWLSGMAGTGKTTIAKTICERLSSANRLGASFFVSRQDLSRRDPCNILRSFSYELALRNHVFFHEVRDCIQREADISSRPMQEQILKLLATPLTRTVAGGMSTDFVLVIDALDECDKQNGIESGDLIPLLDSHLRCFDLKLFITSRNQVEIQDMFTSLEHGSLKLHDIDQSLVAEDVKHYFQEKLTLLAQKRRTPNGWPSAVDIETLTEMTGHLFIYASTSVKFISQSRYNPVEQLRSLLDVSGRSNPNRLRQVDILYSYILYGCSTDDDGVEDKNLCERIRILLGTVILAMEPLCIRVLAAIIAAEEIIVRSDVDALSSILRTPQSNTQDPVQIFHPSLPDFLQDSARCTDMRFFIDSAAHHSRLTLRCLQIMNMPGSLHEDMCDIRNPSLFNAEVRDLQLRLDRFLSAALRYACLHWARHMTEAHGNQELFEELGHFCTTHLLHWIEIMSLFRCLVLAEKQLSNVVAWMKVSAS
jgi:hypothetical protein